MRVHPVASGSPGCSWCASPASTLAVPFVALLALAAGCGSDDATGPEPPPPPLAVQTIGPAGGVLAGAECELEVPSGAFAAAATLTLHREAGELPFGADQAGQGYRIEGLPPTWGSPLELRVRRPAGAEAADDEPALAFGEVTRVPSLDARHVVWRIVPTEVGAEWCACEVPAPEPPDDEAAKLQTWTQEARVAMLLRHGIYATPGGRFEIHFAGGAVPDAQVIALGARLDEAYALWFGKGYRAEARESWPVNVTLRAMAPQTHGNFVASGWGISFCFLEFNTLLLADPVETRRTVGHEVFHFFQYFYDPRSAWAKASRGGPLLWFDEATASWAEALFSDDANDIPFTRRNCELTPLDGAANAYNQGKAAVYGYGMSALIKRLVAGQGDGFILGTYQDAQQGADPWTALLARLAQPIDGWWNLFLDELICGSIYDDITYERLRDERSGLFQIAQPTDTLTVFNKSYADLSGRLYWVRPRRTDFPATAMLTAKVAGAGAAVAAFGFRSDAPLTGYGGHADSLAVPGLRQLAAAGTDLLLLVAHPRHQAPYTATTPLTLTLRVRQAPDFSGFETGAMSLRYAAQWTNGSVPQQGLLITTRNGQFAGATFSAAWDSVDTSNGMRYAGHFLAVLDATASAIVQWSAENRWIYPTPDTYNLYRARGGALPLVSRTATAATFALYGSTACAGIDSIGVETVVEGAVTRRLLSFGCNNESYAEVSLRNDLP